MTLDALELDRRFPGSVSITDPRFLEEFHVKPLLDAIIGALTADSDTTLSVRFSAQRTTSTESADCADGLERKELLYMGETELFGGFESPPKR